MIQIPPTTPLFPYTTLFRSRQRVLRAPRPPLRGGGGGAGRRLLRDHARPHPGGGRGGGDRKSTRLNSSHQIISYAVFCLKKKCIRSTLKSISLVWDILPHTF